MHNPFSGFFRSRDKPQNAISAAPTFFFGSSNSGKTVNPKNAVQMSTVYACVRVIAETIASLPLAVYEDTDTGSQKATDHPLYRVLHDEPNPEMTSFVMREVMLSHLLLWGNSYCQIIRTGKNHVASLYPLLPDRMEVDRDSQTGALVSWNRSSSATATIFTCWGTPSTAARTASKSCWTSWHGKMSPCFSATMKR